MKKLAILSLVLFTLISCSKKKIHCSEVEFAKDFMECKYSGASYTGDVWSDDEKTAIMTFEDGLLTEFKMFENGQVAINIKPDPLTGYNDGEYSTGKGETMGKDEFFESHPDLAEKIVEFLVTLEK